MTEALAAVLGRQQLLLVLDNCEHLLAAVAELCAAVLPVADDVRVLATSREPIGLRRRGPVPAAAARAGVPSDPGVPAAVRLFADRARQADPRFVLDRESGPVAARLVERLDGLPLAIELAAARVEALGCPAAGPAGGQPSAADQCRPDGAGPAPVTGRHRGVELSAA